MQIIWTPFAQNDLHEIRAYIGADDPRAANAMMGRLVVAGNALETLPNRGRPTGLGDIRELIVPGTPYLLVYRILDDAVHILRVWHEARDRG